MDFFLSRIGCVFFGGLAFLSPHLARSEIRLHPIFSDQAVLQQDVPIPVWGGGTEEMGKVTVSLAGQTRTTEVKGGRWRVDFAPISASMQPTELKVVSEGQEYKRKVWIGEVWFASGQSNMWWPLKDTLEAKEAIASAKDPLMKWLYVPLQGSLTELSEVPLAWKSVDSRTVPYFSAVAYYFAREIRKRKNVPVGVIQSAVGGSPIEAWISEKEFQGNSKLKKIPERNIGHALFGRSVLHRAMVAPLMPYALRGFIWYQGESNTAYSGEYFDLMSALIRTWRNSFVTPAHLDRHPFLFVQLTSFLAKKENPEASDWAALREAQRQVSLRVPRTAMAVITDLGDEGDIHPRRKREVGERLAIAARNLAYGEDVEYSGPVLEKAIRVGSEVHLSFVRAQSLVVRQSGERSAALSGVALSDDGNRFYWAKAVVDTRSPKIIVSPSMETKRPRFVRWGWADFVQDELKNEKGFLASPFQAEIQK